MRTREDIVFEAIRTERASIADAVIEHAPGVRKIVAIGPDHARHVAEVPRFLAGQAEWDKIAQGHTASLNHYLFVELLRDIVEKVGNGSRGSLVWGSFLGLKSSSG